MYHVKKLFCSAIFSKIQKVFWFYKRYCHIQGYGILEILLHQARKCFKNQILTNVFYVKGSSLESSTNRLSFQFGCRNWRGGAEIQLFVQNMGCNQQFYNNAFIKQYYAFIKQNIFSKCMYFFVLFKSFDLIYDDHNVLNLIWYWYGQDFIVPDSPKGGMKHFHLIHLTIF